MWAVACLHSVDGADELGAAARGLGHEVGEALVFKVLLHAAGGRRSERCWLVRAETQRGMEGGDGHGALESQLLDRAEPCSP